MPKSLKNGLLLTFFRVLEKLGVILQIPLPIQNNQLQLPIINKYHESIKEHINFNMFVWRSVFYMGYIGTYEDKLHFKFGMSNKINQRVQADTSDYGNFELIFLKACNASKVEQEFKNLVKTKELLTSKTFKNKNRTELFTVDKTFTIEYIITEAKRIVALNEQTQDYNVIKNQLRESQHQNEVLQLQMEIELLKGKIRELELTLKLQNSTSTGAKSFHNNITIQNINQ